MPTSEDEQGIPTIAEGDAQDVYAFVGLTLYSASVLEAELINLAVGLRASLKADGHYRDELEAWFDQHEAMTFGALLAVIRRLTTVSVETEETVSQALKTRNRFVHSFFRDHAEDFLSQPGRRGMIEKLRQHAILFRKADRILSQETSRIWKSLGLTDETIEREMALLKDRASARDAV